MNEFLNLLKNHWQLLVATIVFILSFILQLFKKKPIKIVDTIRETILFVLPHYICDAEKLYPSGNGEEKLNLVLKWCTDLLKSLGVPLDEYSYYLEIARCSIESILYTPQKKGGN